MSTFARAALDHHKPFLQSPVDDLYSFYWVALWAALYNVHLNIDSFTATEKSILKNLSGNTFERLGVSGQIGLTRIRVRASDVQSYPAVDVVYVRRVARAFGQFDGRLE